MNKHVHKLTASALAISLAVIGCTPAVQSQRVGLAAAPNSNLDKSASKLADEAREAAQAGNNAEALSLAERAVEQSPRDLGYLMLLGDLYLKNGRFASAEAAFADVGTLDPGNVRAGLSLALAMIAQGKTLMATAELDGLDGSAAPGDLGLAYALAGQHGRALALLEGAARAQDASARVRQNLALAYALSGDWQKARVTASQDLSAAELPARMEQWAALAKPADTYTQVATLLGVTPVEDPGQPVRLALAPVESAPIQLAEAAPVDAVPVVPVAPAPVVATLAPPVPVPMPVVAAPPAAVALAPAPAPIIVAPIKSLDQPLQFAVAARELVKASPAVLGKAAAITPAPILAFKPVRTPKLDTRPRKSKTGRYVVQIGAYRHVIQAERAWADAQRRYGFSESQAVSTTVTLPGRGTFHRLAVAGFEAPQQAARTCGTIRARGGTCFVRTLAGDAPLQYAARAARRG